MFLMDLPIILYEKIIFHIHVDFLTTSFLKVLVVSAQTQPFKTLKKKIKNGKIEDILVIWPATSVLWLDKASERTAVHDI